MRLPTWSPRTDPLVLAARRLWRTPVFSLTAVLLLGTGMAIAAATVSLVNGGIFRDAARDRGLLHVSFSDHNLELPAEAVALLRADPPEGFEAIGGFGAITGTVVVNGVSRPAAIEGVFGEYFSLFGGVPWTGRLIQAEDVHERAPVAVVSRRFWEAVGGGLEAVGASVAVAGRRLTVIGVVPAPVRPGASGADVWVPAHVVPVRSVVGRPSTAGSPEALRAELAARYGTFDAGDRMRALSIGPGLSPPMSSSTRFNLILMVSVAIAVSLAASLSFGLLLFARMMAQQSAIAMRIVLGATTRDVVRLLASEVVLLAFGATVVAIVAGTWLARFVANEAIAARGWQTTLDLSPDWRVFLCVAGLTYGLALLVVLRLAWRTTHVEALGSIAARGGLGGGTIQAGHTSARLLLVQTAASAALLFGAVLMIRNTTLIDTSVDALDVPRGAVAWIEQSGEDAALEIRTAQARSLMDVGAGLSDVVSTAVVSRLPGSRARSGIQLQRGAQRRSCDVYYVSASTFAVLDVSAARGRLFTDADDHAATPVAVLNQAAAREYWPDLDPIGRSLWVEQARRAPLEVRVIGTVADLHRGGEPEPLIYVPFSLRWDASVVGLVARTSIEPAAFVELFRSRLQAALPDTGLVAVRTFADEIVTGTTPPAFFTRILGVLALNVFVVALGGLYGLTSYMATMRRRELGIRKTVGATTTTLCRMLAREQTPVLVGGAATGISLALAMSSLFTRWNAGFRVFDPAAILMVGGGLYALGLAAVLLAYLPAMRRITGVLRD